MKVDPDTLAGELRRLVTQATSQATSRPPTPSAGDDSGAGLLRALRGLVHACVELFQVSGGGIMLADDQDVSRYVAASDGPGRRLEDAESRSGQGPCTEALVHNRPVSTADLMAETDRWPRLVDALQDDPVRALLGVPIRLGAIPVGTLDVYHDHPHEWDEQERSALVRYGEVVGTTLAAAVEAHTSGRLAAQLQYALDYRIVIERGVGFLMARDGVEAVTAFDRLRRVARNGRSQINEVAEHLLATGRLEAPPPGSGRNEPERRPNPRQGG